MTEYLTTQQAAERLGISAKRIYALIYADKLPAEKFGDVWRIKASDLEKVKNRKPGRPSTKG